MYCVPLLLQHILRDIPILYCELHFPYYLMPTCLSLYSQWQFPNLIYLHMFQYSNWLYHWYVCLECMDLAVLTHTGRAEEVAERAGTSRT